MSNIALLRRNENFIVWEPVPQTEKVFTSLTSVSTMYGVYTPMASIRSAGLPASADDKSEQTKPDLALQYSKMIEMAKKCAPNQSWFDEDFTSLRHPGR